MFINQPYNKFQWSSINASIFKKQCRIFSLAKQRTQKTSLKRWEKSILNDYNSYYLASYMSTKFLTNNFGSSQIYLKQLHYTSVKLFNLCKNNSNTVILSETHQSKKNHELLLKMCQRAENIIIMMLIEPKLELQLGSQIFTFRPYGFSCTKIKFYANLFKLNKGHFFSGNIIKNYKNVSVNKILVHNLLRSQILKRLYLYNLASSVNMAPKDNITNIVCEQTLVNEQIDVNLILFLKIWLSNLSDNNYRRLDKKERINKYSSCYHIYGNQIVIYTTKSNEFYKKFHKINYSLQTVGLSLFQSFSKLKNLQYREISTELQVENYNFTINNNNFFIQPQSLLTKKHFFLLKHVVNKSKGIDPKKLILKINPIITNWSNYYRKHVDVGTLSKFDHHLFKILWKWCCTKYPKRDKRWIKNHFFKEHISSKSVFTSSTVKGNRIFVNSYKENNITNLSSNIIKNNNIYTEHYKYWYSLLANNELIYREYMYLYANSLQLHYT